MHLSVVPWRVDDYWVNEEGTAVPVLSTVYSHIYEEALSPWLFDVLYWYFLKYFVSTIGRIRVVARGTAKVGPIS